MGYIENGKSFPLPVDGNTPDNFSRIHPNNIEIGIYNETDQLVAATLWGPVGTEALLAQFYPLKDSLFLADMDVEKARSEAEVFSNYLEGKGIAIIHARDVLAKMLPSVDMSVQETFMRLTKKAKELQEQYPNTEFLENNLDKGANFSNIISNLLEMDVSRYGEEQAVALNNALSLSVDMPMGNAIYSRDQMNVLLNRRVQSAMKKPIRKPEVALYEMLYRRILTQHEPIIIPKGETFEGGDAYIHDNTVYVGVGVRTSLGAATHIFKELAPELAKEDMKFAIVEDTRPTDQMESIHLDTYSSPMGEQTIAICSEEASFRKVSLLSLNGEGEIIRDDTGMNYKEFLASEGNQIIDIPTEEQRDFGCNFLALNEETIVLPIEDNNTTNTALRSLEKTVEVIDLFENTRGYGAAHCMTGQLRRNR